ncbi:MAG: glycosyltransferase [Ectothiorhodospiraceae bacterium]|nr:glycosyltransferase [Ectothiorhodospiraceae bacterium]
MENQLKDSSRKFVWRMIDVINLIFLFLFLYFLIDNVPNQLWQNETLQLAITMSIIGLWRYGWWGVHFVRAQIFSKFVFPTKRKRADAVWDNGWRPNNLYFMMTTYREDKKITEKVLSSIVREARKVNVPTKLFIGCGDKYDEDIIELFMNQYADGLDIETFIVRQNKPGKRFAIGLTLRAMSRHGVDGNDPVIFMDGDSILAEECLPRCLPFFELDPELNALTTDEKVVVEEGPEWVRAWLTMRFAQRHMAMQSHALSNKVLTLTGRMSIFRAKHVVKHDFIRTIEADHLNHWLWNDFRFLSGDDKSTWYWLLKSGSRMFYVPDALVVTVERIEGNGKERMIQNLMRWSGNMLRNGSRAIALGPKLVGPFIWWCIVDQRIAMWTTLIGPLSAILLSIFISPMILLVYLIWVLFTRTFLSLLLFPYAGRIQISFPFFLFINQLLNSIVKVYMIFRLPKQRWMNRGNQIGKSKSGRLIAFFQNSMASYLTLFWVSILTSSLMFYLDITINF